MGKRLYVSLVTAMMIAVCYVGSAFADVAIDAVHFPDANFRAYVSSYRDTNNDGILSRAEAEAVTWINVSRKEISDLKGIEYFTALKTLSCYDNQLTALDMSKNTALTQLNCDNNQLTSLNVSGCTALTRLSCYFNKLITLDVSGCTALNELQCPYNQLIALDVNKCTTLQNLNCNSNQLITLDVSGCTALQNLNCFRNHLTALDLSGCIALTQLECDFNRLTSLNVSSCTAMQNLNCDNNQLTSLNVSSCTALQNLHCNNNQLTSLNVNGCTALTTLNCHTNKLASLNVSSCTALQNLSCSGNHLTELDVSKNTALTWLYCYNNQLTVLDLSNNTELRSVYCGSQSIYGLNLTETGNPSYPYQFSFTDVMSSDKIANVSDVKGLDSAGTEITTSYANGIALFASKPSKVTYNYDTGYGEVKMDVTVSNIPVTVKIDAENFPDEKFRSYVSNNFDWDKDGILSEEEIANVTGIYVDGLGVNGLGISSLKGIEYFTALTSLNCWYNQLTELDVSNNTALTWLNCSDNQLTELDLSNNTALTELYCNTNQLTTLDVSENTALTRLHCYSNKLTALDVSKNTALESLGCDGNQLTALDVSKNTALTDLNCSYNQLTTLDVSNNTALTRLHCYSSKLTELDLSNNTALEELYCYDNQLTELDLSNNTALITLYCWNNQLTTLDLSKNKALATLSCGGNNITVLDVRSCPNVNINCDEGVKIIRRDGIKPTITTGRTLTEGKTGQRYSVQLKANGDTPITWTASGNLPSWLNLSSSGLISGTPTTAGNYTFTITAENDYGSASATFTLSVTASASKPTITTSTTTLTIPTGTAFSLQLEATGTTPITWTKTGTLPTGLNMSSSGLISGTPKSAQTKTFKVTAKNKQGSDTKSFTITVYVPVSITTAKLADGTADKNYNATLKAKGSNVVWSATGLPDGLSINAKTGKISGKTSKYGEYSVVVRAENSSTHEEKTFTLTIKGVAPTISGSLKTPELNKAYSSGLKAKGTEPIEWSISGNLPDGLTFNEETGTISGTPTSYLKSGYKITITAKGPGGSKSKTVTLKVKGTAPTITGTLKQAELYKAYSAALKVKGSDTIKLSMSGKLPDGLTFDEKTGTISGTPKSYEKSGYKITITASNIVGTKSKKITLKVKGTAPSIKTTKLPNATQWSSYSVALNATGSDPITWRAEGLPSGLSLNGNTIEGTPTVSGKKFTVTVYAENPVKEVKKNLSLRIDAADKPDTVKDTKSPKDTETSPAEPTDKSTPPELPEQEVPESPQDNEDTSHSEGEYVVVARLGEISRDVEGMYDFDVTLSDDAVVGAELVYIANSSEPSNDDEIAEFFDDTGQEITEVPDSRHITISIWLHADTIYNPSIAVKH